MGMKSNAGRVAARRRREFRIRKHVSGTAARPRVSVFKSAKHTYAQLVADEIGVTLASASTLDSEVVEVLKGLDIEGSPKSLKSVAAARAVGIVLARRCRDKEIVSAVFDRNGFGYTGRVKAIAEGAREGGLEF